uniref:Sodium-dependent phosphate transport protein 2B n=1 Tax=Plectus sambesii TaxID=2011161 RepID=A0A914VW69_9BILA
MAKVEPLSHEIAVSDDLWSAPVDLTNNDGKKWRDMTRNERTILFLKYVVRIALLLLLLFVFICSLGLLSDAFRLVGGKQAGQVFRNSAILMNPIAGLMIGVLATVILQSSSTTTSIIVSMVASSLLTVHAAIPIAMGANIGTSMTNTIVSLGQSGNRNEFRRAFAGATVHDMFNWFTVFVLLPVEVLFGLLEKLTDVLVRPISTSQGGGELKLLSVITDPVNNLIVQVDKNRITEIAIADNDTDLGSLIKLCVDANGTSIEPCNYHHIFAYTTWSDLAVGLVLLIISLVVLISCLIGIVKVLQSMLKGQVASIIRKTVDKDFPGIFRHLTGYFVMLIGCVMTILVQSSSVFTSALTPLVGIGVLSIERMYPLTLGSNIGTTFTSLLAALAADSSMLQKTLQISLCHLFFNLFGILIYYPIPFMRKLPIGAAKFLGLKTSKYRWFAIVYLVVMFFLLPVTHAPHLLPVILRNWEFLPKWMHSLRPYDRMIVKLGSVFPCCRTCCTTVAEEEKEIADKAADAFRLQHGAISISLVDTPPPVAQVEVTKM